MDSMKSDAVKTEVMFVTPEIARMMLDSSSGNRKLRQSNINEISGSILRGEWKLTHQGISFDRNGHLRDGHHRLSAIITTGITIPLMVTVGMSPDAFSVIDVGAKRSLSDNTGIEPRVSEPLRLATSWLYGSANCTPARCLHVGSGGLLSILTEIVNFSGTARRYYSSAPMKLAAAVLIMDGFEKDHALEQYRALTTLDFDSMSSASKALIRQVENGIAQASKSQDTFARGLCVFDASKRNLTKIQVSDTSVSDAMAYLKRTIGRGLA